MSPVTPPRPSHYTSLSTPDSSPTRLPVRQKCSLTIPNLPQLDLPPLPEITNPAIRRLALTHSSNHPGEKSRKRDLIFNEHEAVLDNEKLEFVGDGLLGAVVNILLHELYPAFGPGPGTYLKSHMVSNKALAQIADQYHLPEMFIAEAHSKYMIQAAEKSKGSLFEAYVAGLYYSYLMPREDDSSPGKKKSCSPVSNSPEGRASSDGGGDGSEGSGETVKVGTTGSGTPTPRSTGDNSTALDQSPASPESNEEGPSVIETDKAQADGPSATESSQPKNDSGPTGSTAEKTTTMDSEPTSLALIKDDRQASGSAITKVKKNFGLGELADVGLDDLFSHGLKARPATMPAEVKSFTAPAVPPSSGHEVVVESESEAVAPVTFLPPTTTTATTSTATTGKPLQPKTPSHSPSLTLTPTPRYASGRTHGQAFDHLCQWLWPLFTPVVRFLSTYLESESSLPLTDLPLHANQFQAQNIPREWRVEDTRAMGAIGALNQFLGKTYGCGYLPTWITKKRVMDVWRMVAIVKTPEGREFRAEGKRLTKKAAMTVAAYKVWQDLKVWEEEQAELRRLEALEEESDEDEQVLVRAVKDVKDVKVKEKEVKAKEGKEMVEEAKVGDVDAAGDSKGGC